MTYAGTETAGGSTGGNITYTPVPTNTRFWDLIVEGFNWTGAWSSSTYYQSVMLLTETQTSYVCVTL